MIFRKVRTPLIRNGQSVEANGHYIKQIRRLCKDRGIAINKLAVISDVKQSTLDNIVRGLTKNLD